MIETACFTLFLNSIWGYELRDTIFLVERGLTVLSMMACKTIVAGRIHSVKRLLSAMNPTTETCPVPGPELRQDFVSQLPTQDSAILTAVPTSDPDDSSTTMPPAWQAQPTSMPFEDIMHLIYDIFKE